MEKITNIEETIIKQKIKHSFYCDKCNRLIGESIEDNPDFAYDNLSFCQVVDTIELVKTCILIVHGAGSDV